MYLAQDLRHDRKVAVKVLRPELAAIIGAERFLSEIKTTANLQHPHILPLFDSGAADGVAGGQSFLYYVMPYVEGETVRDRLNREKQFPVADAVRITSEVASALDYAHRQGVIHRDIKPENILLHDNRALVADFGIALAASKAGGTRMTETGMSLGTPHYMSPEQAMGEREITARSDVYALGCVLYEMLTGDPPFTGSTAQAIVARVVTESPRSLTSQRHTIPPQVEAAVLTSLEKLPADRFATAAEFAAALGDSTFAARATAARTISSGAVGMSRRTRILIGGLGVAATTFAALAAWGWLRPAPPGPVVRYSMGLPSSQAMRQGTAGVNLAISPDGRRLAYIGPGEAGDELWVRERDRLDATPLAGTVGATNPTFSPDGERIAYTVNVNQVKVVSVSGGPPVALMPPGAGSGGGEVWGLDGWIYFDSPLGLSRVSADGGAAALLIPYDSAAGEIGHAWPCALPNGRGLLFRSRRNLDPNDFEIVAFEFKTRQRYPLAKGLMAFYMAPGYLVYLRADGAVLAAPFDQGQMKLTGPAVPLFEGVMTKTFGAADIALSPTGTLVYVPGVASSAGGVAELVYVTREGSVTPLNPPLTYNPSANRALSLSPDGTRVALDVVGTASPDIWIKQLPAGPSSRLTFDGLSSLRPQWTADGRSVLYIMTPDTGFQSVWKKRADGSSAAELVWRAPGRVNIAEAILSSDGQWLIYRVNVPGGNRDIYAVRPGRDTVPVPLLSGPALEQGAALSPDGKWLAYSSNESGTDEIFVRPFPNINAGRWQVSTGGGAAPRWARTGRELFYQSQGGDLMVVPVTPGATFVPGAPHRLFPLATGGLMGSVIVPDYDLMPDGKRFVMARLSAVNQAPGAGQLVVVDNWDQELKGKMHAGKR